MIDQFRADELVGSQVRAQITMLTRMTKSFRQFPNAWLFAVGVALLLLPGLHRLAIARAYHLLRGSGSRIVPWLQDAYILVGSAEYEWFLRGGVVSGACLAGYARWRAKRRRR